MDTHRAPLVDPDALTRWLDRHLPDGDGPVAVRRHQAGHSCETFFVHRGHERLVLRRPPRPPYLPTAHDVVREHRVLSALAGTPVRAPRPVALCTDESVIGAPFYLMEAVDGRVLRAELPPDITEEHRPALGRELVDALAEIHAVDHRAAGLEGFGKPHGYVERQVARWTKQLAGAAETTRQAREVPDLWTVAGRLAERIPEPSGPSTIVHGDYKLDNVMYGHGVPPRLVAVFDWEMSTLGEPLADVGWMLSYWREPGDPPAERETDTGDLTRLPGFPARAELASRYERRTGRSMRDLPFYTALATWKLAIILEGSYARHLRGTTDDPMFPQLEHAVPAIAARAVRALTEVA